jgi:hypothetical protein
MKGERERERETGIKCRGMDKTKNKRQQNKTKQNKTKSGIPIRHAWRIQRGNAERGRGGGKKEKGNAERKKEKKKGERELKGEIRIRKEKWI